MEASHPTTSAKSRVVIVGAGMSGLSAAHHLSTLASGCFDLTILEASDRIGGRICSSSFCGQRVEMGATWIHGIEGSPIYDIAQRMGFMHGDIPWECMDGFPEDPMVVAEGGLEVPSHVVDSIGDLYKNLFSVIQYTDGGLQQFSDGDSGLSSNNFRQLKKSMKGASVEEYLWEGFKMYVSMEEDNVSCNGNCCNGHGAANGGGKASPPSTWSNRSLQAGVFRMRQNVERSVTAADLTDLNMECNDEYWEYPGEHKTIGRGYSSIIDYLVASLPEGAIQLNKYVSKILWQNQSGRPVLIQCKDGTSFEADHVIITVSLGVLKVEAASSAHAKCAELNRLFHPPLPPWKLQAISKLGFGVVDKCFLSMEPSDRGATFPHMQLVFKEEDMSQNGSCDHGLADIPWWMRKNFSFYPIHQASHIVCTWVTGKEATFMEGLSDGKVIDAVMKTMHSFGYGENAKSSKASQRKSNGLAEALRTKACDVPHVREMARSGWGSNPLFRGSYSYVAVGSSGEDIDTLSEPLPRPSSDGLDVADCGPLQLLFAGEATHRYCYSTTHGAFLSGAREAERLAKHYGLVNTNRKTMEVF